MLPPVSVPNARSQNPAATAAALPPEDPRPSQALLAVEEREIITIRQGDRTGLLGRLEAARRDRLPSGSIKHIVIRFENFEGASHFATTKEFFSTLAYNPPAGFMENLSDTFNVLIYYRPDGANLALIFEPKNYERSLAHMLAWEDTITFDFKNLYFDNTVSPIALPFTDLVIKNIDVRLLSLPENLDLSYSFFAQKLLLISTSKEFMEIMIDRLLVSPPRS